MSDDFGMRVLRVLADLDAMAQTHGRGGVRYPAGFAVSQLRLEQVLYVAELAGRPDAHSVASDAAVLGGLLEELGLEADDPDAVSMLALARMARACLDDQATLDLVYEGDHPTFSSFTFYGLVP